MKKIVSLFFVLLFTGCATFGFSHAVKITDPNGNKYALALSYSEKEQSMSIDICYLDKCYSCEAIHDKDIDSSMLNVGIELDEFNAGKVYVEYKNQKYSCEVK